jgi:YggT family protein
MREMLFVIDTLLTLMVGAFLLRLLFQIVRADFRNPLAQAIVRVTNPVVLPLRRLLPPAGRLDVASVVAVLIAQMAQTAIVSGLSVGHVPPLLVLLVSAALELVNTALLLYQFAVFIYVLLSWVQTDEFSAVGRLLADLCEPLLRPLRRTLPSLGGLDLSPLVLLILLQVLRMVVNGRIAPLLLGMV